MSFWYRLQKIPFWDGHSSIIKTDTQNELFHYHVSISALVLVNAVVVVVLYFSLTVKKISFSVKLRSKRMEQFFMLFLQIFAVI